MDQVNTIVYVDISTPYPTAEITAKQGDAGSRTLEIRLTQSGQPYAISSGTTARIYIRKPDKTIVYNNAAITNATLGYVTAELTSQALAAAGRAQCEIMLYAGQDLLTSIPFILNIIRKVHNDEAVESSNEFGALIDALNEVASLTPEGVVAENSINTVHLKDGAVTTPKIADGAVTAEKLADDALTGEKLSGWPGKSITSQEMETTTAPGLYAVDNADVLFVQNGAEDGAVVQLFIDTGLLLMKTRTGYGADDIQWGSWYFKTKVGTEDITDGAVTSDKLADDVIPSELPADKLLAGAGGRAMQATPYAVRPTESVLRIAKDTAGMPPKTISVPLLSSYIGDTPCSLYLEARAVSGSTASLSPAGNSDAGFISGWTTSGAINGGKWGSFSVENKTGFTGLSILLSSDQAASVDFRNVRVVDAAGIDYVDHATFEAQGTIMEDFPDMPETDATDIPTVAGVKTLLAELEARIAALEGGSE